MQNIATVMRICGSHYNYWKERALNETDPVERKKAIERAFFWLETQASFVTLWALENSKQGDAELQRKLLKARANLSKKLLEYAQSILKELG